MTRNRLFDAWTWWAASLAAHLVLAVELGALGIGLPDKGKPDAPEDRPAASETLTIRAPAPPPEFQLAPPREFELAHSLPEDPPFVDFREDPGEPHETICEFPLPSGAYLDDAPPMPIRGRLPGVVSAGSHCHIPLSSPRGDPHGIDAVQIALRWLARHQNPDGSWSVTGYTARCEKACLPNPGTDDHDAGVTGLSLLAFLGAGYSHLSTDVHDGIRFGDVVRKALQWIMARQDAEGCIGPRSAHKYMYNHLLSAMALCEAYGLTGSYLFRDAAQKAVDFIVAAQNPGKGWRYSFRSGDNDSSVTGWAVRVLKSAELAGLSFPRSVFTGARAWYDDVTEEAYSRVGYNSRSTGCFIPVIGDEFDHHETTTAIGMIARIHMDRSRSDPRLHQGAELIRRDPPKGEGFAIDYAYWHFATLALFELDGPGGKLWKAWTPSLKEALAKTQNRVPGSCRDGSWEPADRWSLDGGRVYATAINALTHEIHYRFPCPQRVPR